MVKHRCRSGKFPENAKLHLPKNNPSLFLTLCLNYYLLQTHRKTPTGETTFYRSLGINNHFVIPKLNAISSLSSPRGKQVNNFCCHPQG